MLRAPIVRVTQIDVFEPDAEGDVGEGETVADEIIAAAIVGVGETQRARDLAFLPLDERGVLRALRAPRLHEARDHRVEYAQRCACQRASPVGGIRGAPRTLSRYSMIIIDSNTTSPSSRTSTGILPSGLRRATLPAASLGASMTKSCAKPFSCKNARTLRT